MRVSHELDHFDTSGWLRPLECAWPRTVCRLLEAGAAVARVLIAEVRGSAPREPGACMLVTSQGCLGTIGGGRLEWQAIQAADTLLREPAAGCPVRIGHFTLGPDLGQCCGGVVRTWVERFASSDMPLLRSAARILSTHGKPCIATTLRDSAVDRRLLAPQSSEAHELEEHLRCLQPGMRISADAPILFGAASANDALLLERIDLEPAQLWLYGAGHVGQALVRVLADLPFEVTWIDERAQFLPRDLPANVRTLRSSTPLATLQHAPPGAKYLVMTHDHALDYSLCRGILEQGTFGWLGLIGSQSKGARFRSRLTRDGVSAALIERLVCPIGVDGILSKWPAAIAVSVATQLLQSRGQSRMTPAVSVCTESECRTCSSVHGATIVNDSTALKPLPRGQRALLARRT